MTAKNIIDQIEKIFGRQPEQYMFQLINDALDDIASHKRNFTVSKVTDLKKHQRWYALEDELIDIQRVEILDTNNRYVMIPKLADSHKLLREDTDNNTTTWSTSNGNDDSLT
tara:strand:- start:197 stop:532 length:336 start_codon:yes stop_codon:yes gene_type:complete